MLKWNIQRFSEIIVEPGPENPGIHTDPFPSPTPRTHTMPSSIAPEAWHNVEEMLVTLSNNVRVKFTGIDEKMDGMLEQFKQLSTTVGSGISELRSLMNEFKTLLAEATVEVPEPEVKDNERQKRERDNPGYLSRKGR